MRTLVSACLLGRSCRYDGRHARNESLIRELADQDILPVCPEELGGLPTPRPAAELTGGDGENILDRKARVVVVDSRRDVTQEFLAGAEACLQIAVRENATRAILKEGSPSCGLNRVQIDGVRVSRPGVSAALLLRSGIEVETRS